MALSACGLRESDAHVVAELNQLVVGEHVRPGDLAAVDAACAAAVRARRRRRRGESPRDAATGRPGSARRSCRRATAGRARSQSSRHTRKPPTASIHNSARCGCSLPATVSSSLERDAATRGSPATAADGLIHLQRNVARRRVGRDSARVTSIPTAFHARRRAWPAAACCGAIASSASAAVSTALQFSAVSAACISADKPLAFVRRFVPVARHRRSSRRVRFRPLYPFPAGSAAERVRRLASPRQTPRQNGRAGGRFRLPASAGRLAGSTRLRSSPRPRWCELVQYAQAPRPVCPASKVAFALRRALRRHTAAAVGRSPRA